MNEKEEARHYDKLENLAIKTLEKLGELSFDDEDPLKCFSEDLDDLISQLEEHREAYLTFISETISKTQKGRKSKKRLPNSTINSIEDKL